MERRAIHQIGFVDDNHVAADGVLAAVDTALVEHLLHTEGHKHGGAFGGQRSESVNLADAVGQHGIQPLKLLIFQR